jgi:hypothetical protein
MNNSEKEKHDAVYDKYKNICLFCNKPIAVLCGTPIIYIGGCCLGKKVGKTMYVFPRKAHIHCWLKKNNYKIVRDKP